MIAAASYDIILDTYHDVLDVQSIDEGGVLVKPAHPPASWTSHPPAPEPCPYRPAHTIETASRRRERPARAARLRSRGPRRAPRVPV